MRNLAIRKAILIGAPGQGSAFLPGVQKDLRDVKSFLCSIRGGLWREDEIQLLHNPTAADTLHVIQSMQAEYLLVYFSGHGYTDLITGARMLCFRNRAAVTDLALTQSISPRLLLMNDACRNYHGEGISGIPLPDPDYFDFAKETSQLRKLFDQSILASRPGKIIVHGTAKREYAMDSKDGGYFTQALLQVARRMTIPSGRQPVNIEQVLYHVPSVLKTKGNHQVPEIIYLSGELVIPFTIAMPLPETSQEPPATRRWETLAQSNGGNELLLGLGLLVMALYLSD